MAMEDFLIGATAVMGTAYLGYLIAMGVRKTMKRMGK